MQDTDTHYPTTITSAAAHAMNVHHDQYYSQFLFDTLRTAALYLDKWGRIRSANAMAKKLFGDECLTGKTVLEVLGSWDNPVHSYQEILRVARTGNSVMGLDEKVLVDNEEHWFQTDKIAVKNDDHGFKGVLYTLHDITPMKQQKLKLAKSEANYRAFVENSDDAIWRIDITSPVPSNGTDKELIDAIYQFAVIGDCNHLFSRIYDVDDNAVSKHVPFDTISFKNNILNVQQFVEQKLHLTGYEVKYEAVSGEDRYLKVSAQAIINDGLLVGIWGVTRDITERRRYVDRLEYQATHDTLTGLPNRAKLQTLVESAINTCDKNQQMALMIIDLDSFKEVNDTLGHDVGDYIIQAIGPRIRQQLAGTPFHIARLGGDEFAILLTHVEQKNHITVIGQKILACIRKYFRIGDLDVEIRASLGVAIFPEQANDFSTLLRYADVAMYCSKKDMSGITLYNPEQDSHSPKRLSLMSELGKAIRNNELTLHFQPKISLSDQRVVGAEVLTRWTHPVMGFISPAEFVPIAEMTDLINDMTDWVLNESMRQMKQWRDQSLDIHVAVNVSARNLLQDNFCEYIECLLVDYDLPASCLELEITESTLMKNTEKTLSILKRLNDIGIELSIDDFGTGYSSLAYLKRLPVKWLKIDYSFIINMLQNEQDQIIVNSTINMAHNLGLSVVAEGVENQEVMERLNSMQCEHAQGFHIARPMPASTFEEWHHNYHNVTHS